MLTDSPARALTVRPWPDPVIDRLGHDPRSAYTEQFWLPILGPSACWLLRRLAAGLEAQPAGFEVDLEETARSIGLGGRGGRTSPFAKTLARCAQFQLVHHDERGGMLLARRKLPPLNRHQVSRLPERLQREHQAWIDQKLAVADDRSQARARRLALSLLELGENVEETERQLIRWRFPPLVCREATAWALARHRSAAEAEGAPDSDLARSDASDAD